MELVGPGWLRLGRFIFSVGRCSSSVLPFMVKTNTSPDLAVCFNRHALMINNQVWAQAAESLLALLIARHSLNALSKREARFRRSQKEQTGNIT